jgi:hypothetical protein
MNVPKLEIQVQQLLISVSIPRHLSLSSSGVVFAYILPMHSA